MFYKFAVGFATLRVADLGTYDDSTTFDEEVRNEMVDGAGGEAP